MAPVLKVSLFVGTGKDKNDAPIPDRTVNSVQDLASRVLSAEFGGVTLYRHVGAWIGANGPVTENGFTIVSFSDKPREATTAVLVSVAAEIRDQLNQACVLVSIESAQIEFV